LAPGGFAIANLGPQNHVQARASVHSLIDAPAAPVGNHAVRGLTLKGKAKLAAIGMVAFALVSVAPAVPQLGPSRAGQSPCPESDYAAGRCLPYVAEPGQDFMAQAVREAVQRGDRSIADSFLRRVVSEGYAQIGLSRVFATLNPANTPSTAGEGTIASHVHWHLTKALAVGVCHAVSGCENKDTIEATYEILLSPR